MKINTGSDQTMEWVDLVSPSDAELITALKNLGLDSFTPFDYQNSLPRLVENKGVFAILVRVYQSIEPGTDEKLSFPILLVFNEKSVLSVREKGTEWSRALSQRWPEHCSIGDYPTLALIADMILEAIFSYEGPLDAIEEKIDEIETHVFDSQDVPAAVKNIYELKGRLGTIARLHRLTFDLLGKLVIRFEGQRSVLQNVIAETDASFQFSGRMLDNLHHLINVQISLASHRTNEIVRVLTLFSVFFMPLTFIAGVYGMNFVHMPELRWRYGYPASLLLMLFVSLGALQWFVKKGWLK